jgi:hypothetical protein
VLAPAPEQVEEVLAELKEFREHLRYLIRLITAAAACDSGFAPPARQSRYKCRPKGSAPAANRMARRPTATIARSAPRPDESGTVM